MMISITRNLARQILTVFRRALNVTARGPGTPVMFRTGPDGLCVRAHTHDAAVEYHVTGSREEDEIAAPFELLNDCKGAKHDDVALEATGGGAVVAGWNDGIPQVVQYDPPPRREAAKFPTMPDAMTENPPNLLAALHEAMSTADAESVRYALNHIQLDGDRGRISATDGRHVLVQAGFEFPWEGNVLIPHRTVFGCKELAGDTPVLIGRTEDWATLRTGPWTIHLRIEKEGRFPAVDDHIQKPQGAVASFELTDADAEFLVQALKRFPSDDEFNLPVTVDLNGIVAIRAIAENQRQPTELVLTRSTCTGEPIRFNTNRNYLARACQLGFRKVFVFGKEVPVLCQDDSRSFVWALLSPEAAIKPSKNAIRIESQPGENGSAPPSHKPQRKSTTMPESKTQENASAGSNGAGSDQSVGFDAVIEQAEAVKTSLRESLNHVGELIALLKKHKKTTKTVQTALASLRQLQSIDA
jgi:hypothetical protein